MPEAVRDLAVVPNCFDLKLRFVPGENFVAAKVLYRGLLDGFEYRGRAKRLVVADKPLELFRYGASTDIVGYQTAGHRLNQRNGDLFLELVRRALNAAYAPNQRIEIRVSADDLLAAVGKVRGQINRKWLSDELAHMKRASFLVESPGLTGWEFSLINNLETDVAERDLRAPSAYVIELNAKLVRVFTKGGWSIINGEVLRQLYQEDAFCRALYLYFATHRNMPERHESELQRIFHRESMAHDEWISLLRKSGEIVRQAAGWPEFEVTKVAMRRDTKIVPRGQVLVRTADKPIKAVAPKQTPATSIASTAAKASTEKPKTRKHTKYVEPLWGMDSKEAELRALGEQAFIESTGDYDSFEVQRVWLWTAEANEVNAQIADKAQTLARTLSNKEKLSLLYQYLLTERIDDGSDGCR